jgi:hypothetical protein
VPVNDTKPVNDLLSDDKLNPGGIFVTVDAINVGSVSSFVNNNETIVPNLTE